MIEKINKIQSLFSVAGYENSLTEYILNQLKDFSDECFIDKLGSVIFHKKGSGDKVLVNVPISSDGLFITHITDDFKGKFKFIGKLPAGKLTGKALRNVSKECVGVVYSDKDEVNDADDLYIDFGVFKKEDLKVKVGDVLELSPSAFELNDNIYGTTISRCANISAHLDVIKNIKTNYDLYYAFTVMDNVGFKGAKTAAFLIDPDICITFSSSFEDSKETLIKLNKGTVVRIKDSHIIVNKNLKDMLIKKLSDNSIPYQIEILSREGLSNNEIMYLKNGILTANINLASKGMDEITECVNIEDYENYKKSIEMVLR